MPSILAWYNMYSTNSSVLRPIPLTIYGATNIVVRNITVLQTPFWNFFVSDSKRMWGSLSPLYTYYFKFLTCVLYQRI
jgi:hypothetical protein